MDKVFELIQREQNRQNSTIELIASENFVSENVLKACLLYTSPSPRDH